MRQEGTVAVERALGRYVQVVPAYTFEEALRRLQTPQDINLVLCGMYFEETRMFDLLRFVRQRFPLSLGLPSTRDAVRSLQQLNPLAKRGIRTVLQLGLFQLAGREEGGQDIPFRAKFRTGYGVLKLTAAPFQGCQRVRVLPQ